MQIRDSAHPNGPAVASRLRNSDRSALGWFFLGLAGLLLGIHPAARAEFTQIIRSNVAATPYSFQVPAGVNQVYVRVEGGSGGAGAFILGFPQFPGGLGGGGAAVSAHVPITPGTTFSGTVGAGGDGAGTCPVNPPRPGYSPGGALDCTGPFGAFGASGIGGASSIMRINGALYIQSAGGGGGESGNSAGSGLAGGDASILVSDPMCPH